MAKQVRPSAGERRAQHPRGRAEQDQHSGEHDRDEAASPLLGFRRRLRDAEGVDERIDKKAERIHS